MALQFLLVCTLLISWPSAYSSLTTTIQTSPELFEDATSETDVSSPNNNDVNVVVDTENHRRDSKFRSVHKEAAVFDFLFRWFGTPPPPKQNQICGVVSDRKIHTLMTHSLPTGNGDFPWHVAIFLKEMGSFYYVCGGSLISKYKIITAAHCVWNNSSKVRRAANEVHVTLGVNKLYSGDKGHYVQIKSVTNIEIVQEFDPVLLNGDLSILTLNSAVEYTDYVKPICLWFNETFYNSTEFVGKVGTAVGWGTETNLREVNQLRMIQMPIVSKETCIDSDPAFYSKYVNEKSFCAGFRNGSGPCTGDSGGGFVVKIESRWYLVGIVSNVKKSKEGSCDSKSYAILTDVGKYLDFVKLFR